jgi:N-acetylglucosamine-6-phosphate deacetylase
MTMDSSVKSLMAFTGTSLQEAAVMSSLNPARILGVDSQKGSIEAGKDGDIIMVDDDFTILATFVEGVLVYER